MEPCSKRDGRRCTLSKTGLVSDVFCGKCQEHWVDGQEPTSCTDNKMLLYICDDTAPAFIEKAKSAAKAAIEFAGNGFGTVHPDVYYERQAKCKACPYWTGSICNKCGCVTALKLSLPTQSCPLGLWLAVPPHKPNHSATG